MKQNFKKHFGLKRFAFSLVELMISLIVVSLVAAAFVPVITKKLATSSVVSGSIGDSVETNEKCEEKFGLYCTSCTKDTCLSCAKNCNYDQMLDVNNCVCKSCYNGVCKKLGRYITQFNMGDSIYNQIPSGAGVTIVKAGESCTSSKCCWQGETSTNCNSSNGDYSGCKRTVCNYPAAMSICSYYTQNNRSWQLVSNNDISETDYQGNANNGLMLCDSANGTKSSYCQSSTKCLGTGTNKCNPSMLWGRYSKGFFASKRVYVYYYTLTSNVLSQQSVTFEYSGSSLDIFAGIILGFGGPSDSEYNTNLPFAASVRCVSPTIANCKEFISDNFCKTCEGGYYMSDSNTCAICPSGFSCRGNQKTECYDGTYSAQGAEYCESSTYDENCEEYSKTEDACVKCKAGYKLQNKACAENSYYMQIGNLLVTKFNMGDRDELAIPSASGVGIADVDKGQRCGSADNRLSKCCWKGQTAASCTNFPDYSGCTRTLCTWEAANAICANYKGLGKTWRLPSTSEISSWVANNKGKGADGLMLCGSSEINCQSSAKCLGGAAFYDEGIETDSACAPFDVWLKETNGNNPGGAKSLRYKYNDTIEVSGYLHKNYVSSVRCVTNK